MVVEERVLNRFRDNFAVTFKGKKKEKERLRWMQDPKSGTHGFNDIVIIEYGQARIKSYAFDKLDTFENKLYSTVSRGDYFGEACLFRQQDLTYFGDIVAETDLQCMTVSRKAFLRIPIHEQKIIYAQHEKWIATFQMVAKKKFNLATAHRGIVKYSIEARSTKSLVAEKLLPFD